MKTTKSINTINPSKSNSHTSLEERDNIQSLLFGGKSFTQIAHHLNRSISTISREIKNNITVKPTSKKYFAEDGNPITPPMCSKLLQPLTLLGFMAGILLTTKLPSKHPINLQGSKFHLTRKTFHLQKSFHYC